MVTPASVVENYFAMPSNKHSGKRSTTQILAVHSAESPMNRGYAKSLTNWSNTSGVEASWNAFADPGVVVRAVNTFYAAWHASWANPISVGYETAAYAAFTREQWLTLEGRRMLERLAIEMAADAAIFDIPLRWLTGAQVNAVRAGNRTIKGLAAHRQIDPANRTDPGDGFPYGYLLKRIKHHSGIKPAAAQAPKPIKKEWYEMALDNQAKNDIRNLLREFLGDVVDVPGNVGTDESRKGNPTWAATNVLTAIWRNTTDIPDAILDAPIELEGDDEGGTTTLRTKIAWLAHEQHRIVDAVEGLNKRLDAIAPPEGTTDETLV